MKQFPEGFKARLEQQSGLDAEQLCESLNQAAEVSLRKHPQRSHHELDESEQVPWCTQGRLLKEKPLYTLDPLFHAAAYYPQEASSMFLDYALKQIADDLPDHPRVIDLCAAPGGKSTLIASFLDGKGLLLANEVIKSRSRILRENIVKWGYDNVVVSNNDPKDIGQLIGFFDVMVVDAPCSGEGMFRKDVAARDEWTPANADMCAARQKRILMDAWPALRPGGYLIYSTCTFNPDENENNLKWLENQVDATVQTLPTEADWGIEKVPINNGNGLAFYPHKVRGEGFFIAIVRKNGDKEHASVIAKKKKRKKTEHIEWPQDWIINAENYQAFNFTGELITLLPENIKDEVLWLNKNLYTIHAGIALGERLKNGINPHPTLAYALALRRDSFVVTKLNREQALKYLKGEWPLDVKPSKGWGLVTYKNEALGFIKGLGNRVNNYFPKEWRIRMDINS